MKRIVYNKLVRDKIPEIISKTGKQFNIKTLDDESYKKLLDSKLNEEVSEYQESKEIEELADILEVVFAIAQTRGITIEELESIRLNKASKRGAFNQKILLVDVFDGKE